MAGVDVLPAVISGAASIASAVVASRRRKGDQWEGICNELEAAEKLRAVADGTREETVAGAVKRDAFRRAWQVLFPERRPSILDGLVPRFAMTYTIMDAMIFLVVDVLSGYQVDWQRVTIWWAICLAIGCALAYALDYS